VQLLRTRWKNTSWVCTEPSELESLYCFWAIALS
jgi:hypothetical protein